jgi:hypothetical protein
MKQRTLSAMFAGTAVAYAVFATPALAEVPELRHTASGHEVYWQNGCLAQYNPKGEAMYYTPECDDKKIAASAELVKSYLGSHGTSSGDKNASLSKKADGTFEVVWKTDCIVDFNKNGDSTFIASTCDDTEIATSTKMVKQYIASH